MNREEYRGSLWKKTSSKGNTYYTGKLKIGDKEYQVTLFNNNKTSDKSPDFNLIVRDSVISQENQKQVQNVPENKSSKELDDKVFEDFGNNQFYVDELSLDDFNDSIAF